MNRSLTVFVSTKKMGELKDVNGFWAFEYAHEWVNSDKNFSLSPDIPIQNEMTLDTGTKRPVQSFFDNLLPEENARKLLAKDAQVDHSDSFALLEVSGIESAGALIMLPEGSVMPEPSAEPLELSALSERIKALPKAPLNKRQGSRMSLAGAQHKMLIIKKGSDLFEGNAGTPSTHILKPDHSEPDDYWQTTCNEWFVMRLAKMMGIDVPKVELLYVPEPIYLVERFDRYGKYPNQERRHIIDACQLLSFGKDFKYAASTVEIYKKILGKVRTKAQDTIKLYRWVIFNLLIGNGDAHLKNISFYYGDGNPQLTPFYDLLSTVIYVHEGTKPLEQKLSIPINGKETFDELKRDDVLAFANEIGMPGKGAATHLDTMVKNIQGAFEILYKEVLEMPTTPTRAGELRMLREIQYKVLNEMVERLRPS